MEKVIFTNGCFDILHRGHIELFRYAKSLGNKLIVGIDSDEKVKRDKGQDRPFNCLEDRIAMLEAIKYIDKVVSFDTRQELEDLIKSHNPDVLVVGSDWKGKEVVGDIFAKEVKFFDRIGDYSTTKILENNK
jgi:D-beta-D-heptose 7-phosphate kinase/D-beta-D-heptose 1-phosphate adenosyltransferase